MEIDWPLAFEGASTVLEPLAAASWPIAVGVTVWLFREPIKQMAARVKNLSVPGASAQFGSQEQLGHQRDAEATNVPQISTSSNTLADPLSDLVYDKFDNELRELLDEKVAGGAEQKIKWAIRARSISECNRIHESNYRLIFGSQITVLKAVNVAGQMQVAEVRNFYEHQISSNAEWGSFHKERTFEQWLQFLIDADYIDVNYGATPSAAITAFGKQFLQWMAMAAASEFKFG